MTCLVNRIFNFAFLTVLVAGTAITASAQQATFHLPFEAKWGSLVLTPGDYRVQLPEPALGKRELLVQGPTVGFVMTMSSDSYGARKAASDSNFLQLVKIDDVYYVAKYEEGSRATTLMFKVPKDSHREQMAAREVINIPTRGN